MEIKTYIPKLASQYISKNITPDVYSKNSEKLKIHYIQCISDVDYSDRKLESDKFYSRIEGDLPFHSLYTYFDALLEIPSCKDEVQRFVNDCQNKIEEISSHGEVASYIGQIRSMLKIVNFISILPENYSRIYFINTETKSVGVIIYGNGTLNIEFKKENIAQYTHALKSKHGGMPSSDGRIKITKHQKNSQYIKHALDFIR
ncbi:hypothetical protein PY793_04010 [Acetobacter fabarum]|uniref:hypothetical protein n=1 Tax=Acetobacter fabarum TaxID=483199 RepID=UPI00312BA788